ncbi:MAG: hypothetical protein ACC742_04645 [Thermoanaerobaculales bacterium]
MERPTRRPPSMQAPPRIPAVGDRSQNPDAWPPQEDSGWIRRTVLSAVFVALILGLVGVFVLLPRWAQNNEGLLAVTGTAAPRDNPAPDPPAAEFSKIPSQGIADRPPEATPRPSAAAPPTPIPSARAREPRVAAPPAVDDGFTRAMTEGLEALELERWTAAREAFEGADRIRPGAPEVKDGLTRANAGLRREAIESNIQRAARFEAAEAWREADNAYSKILEIEPAAALAREGRDRAAARAGLDDRLEFHLQNPTRLSSLSVLESAGSTLAQARAITPRGPRLENQITRLEQLIATASGPVPVVLESDNLTEVVVFRVGELGTFTRRQLSLRPGVYTIVGSRLGFRDVRLRLEVKPGTPAAPLMVRCTEAL